MRLTALTYNIHGCVGRGGRYDSAAILDVLRAADADIVALQEVEDDDRRDRSFLHALGELGYPTLIYGSTLRRAGGRYGNLLLSRLQVQKQELIVLTFLIL